MSSQSTDPVLAPASTGDAERDARIEQLLLAGLDHYFAGQYERAISVWTRVVFLERRHDRARAYIERARSAMAERQRRSEELLGTGIAAYNAGDVDKARELLTQAAEAGNDTAHLFLDRLNRIDVSDGPAIAPAPPQPVRGHTVTRPTPARPRRLGWGAVAALAVVVAAVMLVSGLPIGTWISNLVVSAPATPVQAPPADPLPVIRSAEITIARARELHDSGRLHDALQVLDRVSLADPLRAEADELRARIQADLLTAAGLPVPAAPAAGRRR